MVRFSTLFLILLPFLCKAQHNSLSYQLQNEVGTHRLVSLTFSHDLDNTEGVTFVLEKHGDHFDTIYQIDRFLHGWVALSNDGQTVAHLVAEKDKEPLSKASLSLFRNGEFFDSAELERLIHYELQMAKTRNRIPESGWLRNDSIYHKMATHPFYVTEDKLFISFDNPKLTVFDLSQMFHIYTGNGANHFLQNYYALPNAPYRTEFDGDEYFPNDFPKTIQGKLLIDVLSKEMKLTEAIPEEAQVRVEITLKLNADGSSEVRSVNIYDIRTNEKDTDRGEKLKALLETISFDTDLIPPDHPSWIFERIFWMR